MARCSTLAIALLALSITAASARGDGKGWTPSGVQLSGFGQMYDPAVVGDGGRGWYVAWTEGTSARLAHLDSGGEPIGAPLSLPADLSFLECSQVMRTAVCSDGFGGAVVMVHATSWMCDKGQPSFSSTVLYRIQAAGGTAPGFSMDPWQTAVEFPNLPELTGDGRLETLYPDGRGGAYAFAYTRDMNRVDSSGVTVPGWHLMGDLYSLFLSVEPEGPNGWSVSLTAHGPWAVASDLVHQAVLGMTPDSVGDRSWSRNPVLVDTAGAGTQLDRGILVPSGNGALVFWRRVFAHGSEAHVLPLSSDGSFPAGWVFGGVAFAASADTVLAQIEAVADSANGAFVAWNAIPPVGRNTIRMVRLGADGHPAPGWAVGGNDVLPSSAHFLATLASPTIAPDGMGGSFLAWSDTLASAPTVRVLRYLGDGSLAPGWSVDGEPVHDDLGAGNRPVALVSDGLGGAIVCWNDDHGALYINRVGPGGVVTTFASLDSASIDGGDVRLEWLVTDPIASPVAVERGIDGGAWVHVADVTPDNGGIARFSEPIPTGARSLGYRLTFNSSHGAVSVGETTLVVPIPPPPVVHTLALLSLAPNPAHANAALQLDLASGVPVEVALFDIAGRRVWRESISAGAGGAGTVTLDRIDALPAGVYRVRVSQGAAHVGARLVITR